MDILLSDQLSVFDAPIIIDSTPIPPTPKPEPTEYSPGDLVVPKAREGHPVPLFPDQVCEVVRIGQSLGRDCFFCVPVKWKSRGVPAFPCNPLDLLLLVPARGGES
ncbi:hypothetical protein N836_31745 [Leptolyngbya sp. Heron Island J]|uniref:hypothetical protein n=1 Tax=Leptolyngbya sp. Heron Island J TaxID=1385935 RepID=UPI0003B95A9A|nr:hypothetical protein [Leptolyngbya sp. Heron Island J]ESA38515.1 hypothetical protein N836_31745 [Leptolyngbya sp. Heron Island J]